MIVFLTLAGIEKFYQNMPIDKKSFVLLHKN